ncbi:hypothetical protein KFL_000200430 [Klebsormidium nitens]|uniref:C3H1-type domain-containing protein n=1 Tax=Klebsormidium nitens TaxID=105231 RepID=A0A1Y1HPJ0_KLENI|nr:hypothetical protein KFL_000200430 [Klebsormidium nitens]|eukprot:GAQ78891.1 hypothetical protein KFL_000200430 [Klebsormidium nitens]
MPPLVWGGPQVGFQQAAFAPPAAYAPPPQQPVPLVRTGFDHSRLQAAPPAPRQGTGSRRPGGRTRGPGHVRCFTWWNTGACTKGTGCAFAKAHKSCPCGDPRDHAPGPCPNRPASPGDSAAAPDHRIIAAPVAGGHGRPPSLSTTLCGL